MPHPIQFFARPEIPCEDKFEPIVNIDFVKPEGGMWTSTWNPETGSDWVQWCIENEFGVANGDVIDGWKLEVAPHARILTIDSMADLKAVHAEYGSLKLEGMPDWIAERHRFLDFENLAKHFDGIHLTEQGQWATRLPMNLADPNLYGWDVESTLWLHWCFMDVTAWSIKVPQTT